MRSIVSLGVALTLATGGVLLSAAPASAVPGGVPIASAHSGKCVDLAAGSMADGGSVIQFTCHDRDNQRWHITRVVGSNAVKIRNAQSNRCLDIAEKSIRNGAAVHQWDCQDGDRNTDASEGSQLWNVQTEGSARGWTYYRFANVKSGKCLDVPGGSTADGVVLVQYDCNGKQNQQWRMPNSAGR
ncbi:MAG: RICIN domain-containing protein [Pseudonocardia sp.]